MSKPSVPMIVHIDHKPVPVGYANPAQARILVKKELATWQDGSLLILLRPAFRDLLSSNGPHLMKGPFDDENTSLAELDRRLMWFKHFVGYGALALATPGLPSIPVPEQMAEASVKMDTWMEMTRKAQEQMEADPEQMQDLDLWFEDPKFPILPTLNDAPLDNDPAPDVTTVFGRLPRPYVGPGLTSEPLEEQDPKEVYRSFHFATQWGKIRPVA